MIEASESFAIRFYRFDDFELRHIMVAMCKTFDLLSVYYDI
jgi:hypothetical protein